MSTSNLTLDELMISLKQPLPEISGYMEIIWDVDEPSFLDLDKVFGGDLEYQVEKKRLSSEIKETLDTVVKMVKKESITKIPSYDDISYDLDNMTVDEILATMKCKCRAFRDKYGKKSSPSLSDLMGSLSQLQKDSERPILTRPKIGAACKQYLSVKDYAISFIDDLLQEAVARMSPTSFSMDSVYIGEDDEYVQTHLKESIPSVDMVQTTDMPSWVSYLLIEDFTPSTGRHFIMDILKNTWELKKDWSYCIDFKAEHSDTCADFYIYEVRWSRPTMSYPIPQVTASVYFTIEVSRVKPRDCPVNVSYNFETERYKFTLDDDIRHETFLDNIVKYKMGFFKSIRH